MKWQSDSWRVRSEKEKAIKETPTKWFAWHPVRIGEEVFWLCYVNRKFVLGRGIPGFHGPSYWPEYEEIK